MHKHTQRLLAFSALSLLLVIPGDSRLRTEWTSLLAISVALVWAWAATDDFRSGTQERIPLMLERSAAEHPIRLYRAFLRRLVRPHAKLFGWAIPASMYLIALAYLAGVGVTAAAVGALFLLVNMFLFLELDYPRDDYVALTVAQLIILIGGAGGIPSLLRAMG